MSGLSTRILWQVVCMPHDANTNAATTVTTTLQGTSWLDLEKNVKEKQMAVEVASLSRDGGPYIHNTTRPVPRNHQTPRTQWARRRRAQQRERAQKRPRPCRRRLASYCPPTLVPLRGRGGQPERPVTTRLRKDKGTL